MSPAVVVEMDAEDIAAFSCYHEGKGLAEWANQTDPRDPVAGNPLE